MQRKYEIVAELWNNGLTEQEIASKLKLKIKSVKKSLRIAKLEGIELKEFSERKKAKTYLLIAEDWNNGLSKEEILRKYKITEGTLHTYLSNARKDGIEVKKRDEPIYEQVAKDWNNGLSKEEIMKKYGIAESTFNFHFNSAKQHGIQLKEKEQAKKKIPQYVLIAQDWNSGLNEEKIMKKYNITNSTLQIYLSRARKYGIKLKKKERKQEKNKILQYELVVEDLNNGLSEEENIDKSTQKKQVSEAKKEKTKLKEREKIFPRCIQIAEDWNNGLLKEKIMKRYQITEENLRSHLRYAKMKYGIEIKKRKRKIIKKKIPQFIIIAQEWNNGLSEEEILSKYNIKKSTLQHYLTKAKKAGIEIIKREIPRYILVAQDWNNGLSKEKIMAKYQIKASVVRSHLKRAKSHGIEVDKKEVKENKRLEKKITKYVQITQDWNSGLNEVEIMRKYGITKSTMQDYLYRARKNGILVTKRLIPRYIQVTEDFNNGLTYEEIMRKYNIKKSTIQNYLSRAKNKTNSRQKMDSDKIEEKDIENLETQKIDREMIKKLLKTFLPRQVAKRLKISRKTVFDIIDSFNSEEKKEIDKAFVRNRQYVFSKVEKYKNKGKSLIDILKKIDDEIPLCFLSQLLDVFYKLELYSNIEKSINRRIYSTVNLKENEKAYLYKLKETMQLEVVSLQIREKYKEVLKSGKTISYDRLCKEYNVRESFLVDLLGREEKDY